MLQEILVFAMRAYDHIVYSLGQDAKGCFWKISDDDNIVYLLGSIHSSDNSLYPLSRDIYFLIVGVGHMLNHNGIVELLKQAGYTVEQVK